ncbi:beta-ketoacyl-ACP synthase II [Zhengella mangrovi]|uniref:Beta-ketoacyl-ACP synthase II n=1 Tax=Zhengella mangrovi TaxID=1982044 RepID=A0A2G1QPL4_9HYPH|nr:beta-ketoacyl-ACP synthase [Zhengella mangrovi]PHP67476.1 beta-ketoacyl-ACP synthase II [Zhengella mangrovi]
MSPRDAVITGIGIVSCLGEGVDAHRAALSAGPQAAVLETEAFAPYTVHPLPEIDWSQQIPKRGDQRQMETWQRIGTYAAGLALDDAGMKGDEQLCATMDMIVAAGGGERDEAADSLIIEAAAERNDRDVLLNEKLTTELRPTLFLAQLSNLLAGNISIVHKVTGSSRTFMGEEGSGVSAVDTAVARIRAGQSTHALVGGSYNCEHPDMLLAYELGGYLHHGSWAPVWNRGGTDGGGIIPGSGGAFLVLESREHAEQRGARIYAVLGDVKADRTRRDRDDLASAIAAMARDAAPGARLAISSASGVPDVTAAEASALSGVALRAFSSLTGHFKEAQFPFAIALAALAIEAGIAVLPFSDDEAAVDGPVEEILATAIGFISGEGMVSVRKA